MIPGLSNRPVQADPEALAECSFTSTTINVYNGGNFFMGSGVTNFVGGSNLSITNGGSVHQIAGEFRTNSSLINIATGALGMRPADARRTRLAGRDAAR